MPRVAAKKPAKPRAPKPKRDDVQENGSAAAETVSGNAAVESRDAQPAEVPAMDDRASQGRAEKAVSQSERRDDGGQRRGRDQRENPEPTRPAEPARPPQPSAPAMTINIAKLQAMSMTELNQMAKDMGI